MTARLTPRPGVPARLRALLDSGQTILAPGAFDPLSARLVEEAGFPAVYMTGFGTSAALIGRPAGAPYRRKAPLCGPRPR